MKQPWLEWWKSNFLEVFFLLNIIIIMDSSYLQWLAHQRHYNDPTPSIFTLFAQKIGIVWCFQITVKLSQIWSKTKNIQFSYKCTISCMHHFEWILHIWRSWCTGGITRTPSIFIHFRKIVGIASYFQITFKLVQIW